MISVSCLVRFERADVVLLLHFFREFFESDLLSVRDRLKNVFAGVAAVLASFGLMLPVLLNHKYRVLNALPTAAHYNEAAFADKLMFVCISMAITAAGTLLNWQSLFPDFKDFVILGPLPLRRLQLFRSKALALLLFTTLLIVSVNVLPAFSVTAIMSGRWQQPNNAVLQIVSFFAGCALGGYLAFFSLLTLQGLMLGLLPPRWFASWSAAVQTVLLTAIGAALPLALWIPGLHSVVAADRPFLRWLPPMWFVGLSQSLLKPGDAVMRDFAVSALCALGAAGSAAVLLYVWAYARGMDQLSRIATTKQPGFARRFLSRILSIAADAPQELAIMSFTAKTICRSRSHKLFVAAAAGGSLALVLDGFVALFMNRTLYHHAIRHAALLSAALTAPLVIAFFLLTGLLFVFSIPIEVRANWIFRLADMHGRDWPVAATEKVLLIVAACISVATGLCLSTWIGAAQAAQAAVFVLLMCVALSEALLWNWNRLPFTCPYLAGKRNLIQSGLIFAMGLSGFAYLAVTIAMLASDSAAATLALYAALAAVVAFLRFQRRRVSACTLFLRFDDMPEPDVQILDIRGE